MGPAEHLDDTTFLTVLVDVRLVDGRVLPDKVGGFKLDGELSAIVVSCLDDQGESVLK